MKVNLTPRPTGLVVTYRTIAGRIFGTSNTTITSSDCCHTILSRLSCVVLLTVVAGSAAAQLFRPGAGLHPVPGGALPLFASKNAAHGDKIARDAHVRATIHNRAVIRGRYSAPRVRGCCVMHMHITHDARGVGGSVSVFSEKKKKDKKSASHEAQATAASDTDIHTVQVMSRLPKITALVARSLSSTSAAVRATRVSAPRTRRVPEGPGLAYFVESFSAGDGDQKAKRSSKQGMYVANFLPLLALSSLLLVHLSPRGGGTPGKNIENVPP